MTMIASGAHHFQMIYSSPTAVTSRLKESTMSPAQVSHKEASPNTTTNLKESVKDVSCPAPESTTTSLAFVYGTLKRGFGNHWLMEEQLKAKHCRLVGTAKTKHKYPLVCGPFQVPFLLDVRGSGEHVRGELYEVDSHCLGLLDDLEGTSKGHYMRCPVTLTGIELDQSFLLSLQSDLDGISFAKDQKLMGLMNRLGEVQAEAYFAALHYTDGLYQAPHLEAYTEKESASYTRRIHRPQNRTFIEHVYHWIDEQQRVFAVSN